jgi:hypothetical protein
MLGAIVPGGGFNTVPDAQAFQRRGAENAKERKNKLLFATDEHG